MDIRLETTKYVEENIGRTRQDLCFGNVLEESVLTSDSVAVKRL